MQGYVEDILHKERNGKPYWILKIEGNNYTVWDRKYIEGIKKGSLVAYEFKQSGNYRHITSLKPLEGSLAPYSQEELRIIRMSCLRSAVNLTSEMGLEYKDKVEATIHLAKQFEKYVLGDLDIKEKAPDSLPRSNKK
jgi:hypothetical protein